MAGDSSKEETQPRTLKSYLNIALADPCDPSGKSKIRGPGPEVKRLALKKCAELGINDFPREYIHNPHLYRRVYNDFLETCSKDMSAEPSSYVSKMREFVLQAVSQLESYPEKPPITEPDLKPLFVQIVTNPVTAVAEQILSTRSEGFKLEHQYKDGLGRSDIAIKQEEHEPRFLIFEIKRPCIKSYVGAVQLLCQATRRGRIDYDVMNETNATWGQILLANVGPVPPCSSHILSACDAQRSTQRVIPL